MVSTFNLAFSIVSFERSHFDLGKLCLPSLYVIDYNNGVMIVWLLVSYQAIVVRVQCHDVNSSSIVTAV